LTRTAKQRKITLEDVMVAPLSGNKNHMPSGKFAPGNNAAADRSNGSKRRQLAAELFNAVGMAEFSGMVANMIRIAQDQTAPHAAVRAFSVLADTLGLKLSTLEIVGDGEQPTMNERRQAILARLAELGMALPGERS
jgi:hypothetical protein